MGEALGTKSKLKLVQHELSFSISGLEKLANELGVHI